MDFDNPKVYGDTSTFESLVWKEIIWLLETLFNFRRKSYLPVEMRSHLLLFFSNVSQFVFSSFFATMHELSRNCHTRTFGFQRSSMKYQNEKLSLFERCSTRFFLKKSQQNFNVFNKISDFFLINFTFDFFCVRKHIVFMLSAFLFGIIRQIHMQIIIFKYFFLHFLPQDWNTETQQLSWIHWVPSLVLTSWKQDQVLMVNYGNYDGDDDDDFDKEVYLSMEG